MSFTELRHRGAEAVNPLKPQSPHTSSSAYAGGAPTPVSPASRLLPLQQPSRAALGDDLVEPALATATRGPRRVTTKDVISEEEDGDNTGAPAADEKSASGINLIPPGKRSGAKLSFSGAPPRSAEEANGSDEASPPVSGGVDSQSKTSERQRDGLDKSREPTGGSQRGSQSAPPGQALSKLRDMGGKVGKRAAVSKAARERAEQRRRREAMWERIHSLMRLDAGPRLVYNVMFCIPTLWITLDATYALVRDPGDPWETEARLTPGLDIFLSFLWLFDFAIGFITPVYDPQACDWDSDQKTIVPHYKRSITFWVDLLPIFPVEILWRGIQGHMESTLARSYHLPRAIRGFAKTVKVWYYFDPSTSYPGRGRKVPASIQCLYILFWVIAPLHVLTVITIALHRVREGGNQDYIPAAYWVAYTITSVGYGDIAVPTPELQIWAIFVMALGTVVLGTVIGRVSEFIMRKGEVECEVERGLQEMASLLDHYHIPSPLRTEILSFHTHYLENNVFENHEQKIMMLPETMRDKIRLYVRMKLIQMVPMFATVSGECQIALAAALQQTLVDPNTQIIQVGDVGREMFFLSHGSAEVIVDIPDQGPTVVKIIRKGEFFGEIALLWDTPRTASVRTVTYCDFFMLDKEDFITIAMRFQDFERAIQAEIDRRKISGGVPPSVSGGVTVLDKLHQVREEFARQPGNTDMMEARIHEILSQCLGRSQDADEAHAAVCKEEEGPNDDEEQSAAEREAEEALAATNSTVGSSSLQPVAEQPVNGVPCGPNAKGSGGISWLCKESSIPTPAHGLSVSTLAAPMAANAKGGSGISGPSLASPAGLSGSNLGAAAAAGGADRGRVEINFPRLPPALVTAPKEAPQSTERRRSLAAERRKSCGQSAAADGESTSRMEDVFRAARGQAQQSPGWGSFAGAKRQSIAAPRSPADQAISPLNEDDSFTNSGTVESASPVSAAKGSMDPRRWFKAKQLQSTNVLRALVERRERDDEESDHDEEGNKDKRMQQLIEQGTRRLKAGGVDWYSPGLTSSQGLTPAPIVATSGPRASICVPPPQRYPSQEDAAGRTSELLNLVNQTADGLVKFRQQYTLGLRFTTARQQDMTRSLNGLHQRIDGLETLITNLATRMEIHFAAAGAERAHLGETLFSGSVRAEPARSPAAISKESSAQSHSQGSRFTAFPQRPAALSKGPDGRSALETDSFQGLAQRQHSTNVQEPGTGRID